MYRGMIPIFLRILSATSLSAICLSGSASFGQSLPDNLIQAELLPGWTTESGAQMVGLRLTLAPGWKTYWRAPGEAGIPPQFDWTESPNLAGVSYHWPSPQVFDVNGLRTIAYKNELVLPIEFLSTSPGANVDVAGTIRLGVCKDICVPVVVSVSGKFGDSAKPDPAIHAALATVPRSGASAGIAKPHCNAEPIKDGMRLTTEIAMANATAGDFAVVEMADSSVWVTNVSTEVGNGHLLDVSDLIPSSARPFTLNRSDVTITVFAKNGEVIELQGCKG